MSASEVFRALWAIHSDHKAKAQAIAFVEKWRTKLREGAKELSSFEKQHDQEFVRDFLAIFGFDASNIDFQKAVKPKTGRTMWIDALAHNVAAIEVKSPGRGLDDAETQLKKYIRSLDKAERPRYRIVSNFEHFRVCDIHADKQIDFSLEEFPNYIEQLHDITPS